MTYDYRCKSCGVMEISHGMMESRKGRKCPTCKKELKPMISGGSNILLTGRPPWAYNDIINAARASQDSGGGTVNSNTTVTDKRDGSPYKGKKQKINNSMGNFNAQW